MATNFTNKYMQVFQNYNKFSEHSADYVRGEDHIAFLIEENEVIYWLYLEQVWRPLNVRTTTTGQLEDGRTKVAVRLEYIEGGQKYTSVPNIPDPERITSMSRFLEDYPDIEEVNVSGTVNLTDLSYAFAGSKIKDFSMLDINNVNDISYCFSNINNENLNINISLVSNIINILGFIDNSILHDVIINIPNVVNIETDYIDTADSINLNTLTLNANKLQTFLSIGGGTNNPEVNINTLNIDYYAIKNLIDYDGNRTNTYIVGTINNLNSKIIKFSQRFNSTINIQYDNINCDEFLIKGSLYSKDKLRYLNTDILDISIANVNYSCGINRDYTFGSGLIVNANTFKLNEYVTIGAFSFVTDEVNDDFVNNIIKDSNCTFSLLQYKEAGISASDINITENCNGKLYLSVNDDIELNNNVEIYKDCNLSASTLYLNSWHNVTYNKFIIDNTNVGIKENSFDYPLLTNDKITVITDGYISGRYTTSRSNNTNGGYIRISEYTIFKNIEIYNCQTVDLYDNILKDKNIKIITDNDIYCRIITNYAGILDVDSLIINNILNITITCSKMSYMCTLKAKNSYDVQCILFDSKYGITSIYYYFYKDFITNPDKPFISKFDDYNLIILEDGLHSDSEEDEFKTIYIGDDENLIGICDLFTTENRITTQNYKIENIYGNVSLILPSIRYNLDNDYNVNNSYYKHIDISISSASSDGSCITYFTNVDNETLINMITKLNTRTSSTTIYMYRSQANIIGEDNIAAAVDKNYEIAIIEN